MQNIFETLANATRPEGAKHTPGPWKVDYNFHLTSDTYYKIIAGDGCLGPGVKGFSLTGVMCNADAKLIAAAPELLEALQKVYKDAKRDYEHSTDKVQKVNARHYMVLVESVINKATL